MSCGTYLAVVSLMCDLWSHPLVVLVGEASDWEPGRSRRNVQRNFLNVAESVCTVLWCLFHGLLRHVVVRALRGTKHSFVLLRSHVSLALCLVRAASVDVTQQHSIQFRVLASNDTRHTT